MISRIDKELILILNIPFYLFFLLICYIQIKLCSLILFKEFQTSLECIYL